MKKLELIFDDDRSEASMKYASSAKSRRNVALSERSESICSEPRMDGRVSSGRVSDGKRDLGLGGIYLHDFFMVEHRRPPAGAVSGGE